MFVCKKDRESIESKYNMMDVSFHSRRTPLHKKELIHKRFQEGCYYHIKGAAYIFYLRHDKPSLISGFMQPDLLEKVFNLALAFLHILPMIFKIQFEINFHSQQLSGTALNLCCAYVYQHIFNCCYENMTLNFISLDIVVTEPLK